MCSLMEHSARSFREEMARQEAEREDTPETTPNNGELLGTSVKI